MAGKSRGNQTGKMADSVEQREVEESTFHGITGAEILRPDAPFYVLHTSAS